MNKTLNIAIVRLSAIGDIVHSCIVLQFIKRNLLNVKITWIADEKFGEILDGHEHIDRLVLVPLKDKKFKKTFHIVRSLGKFDVAIDLQGLIKSAIITKLLSKNSYGFDKKSIKEPLASLFYATKLTCDYNENIILRNLKLASFALNFNFLKKEILTKSPCLKNYTKQQENSPKRILIAPFASEADKCYDKFKDVILGLGEYEILVCYANEKERVKALALTQETHARLLDKMSLNQLVGFINGCDLVIGNDSGVTHIAWAQNVASITLFGNRPSHRNAYATSQNLVIDAGKKIDAKKIDKNDLCIKEILPQSIIQTAKKLLS
ncbi:lipopolysaccharide heptosyltransferase I [Campylobacter suis]|uniref:Lipopolysaccharide heptosyltransferase 1 n=1 Tax=Campylobacter suis TaxID=2790657 RepID=A0ABM8Q0X7_9BACT|nr:lipopolysaccharide heptosyltransferase I [Campylobacter suis]CAD7286478.1 Lipopolysaccharide heptosyltransferase 1 [Campylobacter suis]